MNDMVGNYKEYSNKLYIYEQGSYGPIEAEQMLEKDGRKWIYNEN